MAEYDGISEYIKAAPRRLQDARELLQPPSLHPNRSDADERHLRGAIYLAGYAVECILKAYIISRRPPAQSLSEVAAKAPASLKKKLATIHSAAGHNLNLLLALTDLEKSLDTEIDRKKDWGICLRWKSTWRYNPDPVTREFADEFIQSADRLYAWIKRQL